MYDPNLNKEDDRYGVLDIGCGYAVKVIVSITILSILIMIFIRGVGSTLTQDTIQHSELQESVDINENHQDSETTNSMSPLYDKEGNIIGYVKE